MNASVLKEGNNALVVAIAAAIVAGAIGFFGGQYNNNSAAQSAELREHDRDISDLKASRSSDERDIDGTKIDVKALGQGLSTLSGQIGALKSAVDSQTEAVHGFQKRIEDLGDRLRPDPIPSIHR